MINDQLKHYIRDALNSGKARDDIKRSLLDAGWQEINIDEAFNTLETVQTSSQEVSQSRPKLKSASKLNNIFSFFLNVHKLIVFWALFC